MFAVPSRALAIVAAAGIGACTSVGPPLAPAPGHDIHLPAEARIIVARVTRGDTLASLLRAHDITEAEIAALVDRVAQVFDLRRMRVDQPYRIGRAIDGALRLFEYEIDRDQVLRVARSSPGHEPFVASVAPIAKTARALIVRGAIDGNASSLFAAMGRAGETPDLSIALAEIFGSEIDFNTELQPGDRFDLRVEKLYRADEVAGSRGESDGFLGYGPILAARFENDGRRLTAVRFDPEDGSPPSYYDEQGRSLKRFFLRSPLKFDPVVTSGFSRSRLHPVLDVRRAHLGVDYRAPVGAPVVAVANGTVVSAGWNGGAGRMVHLRHANGFETQYLHLSATTVRRGAKVSQGDIVGRVGATGLATGPHLDYRLRKNGVFINPVTAHRAMPPGDPVPDAKLEAFRAQRDRAVSLLERSASGSPGPPD
jgi:murein DD-endopeptidase MepM/ murein hydrolase activator NlpD